MFRYVLTFAAAAVIAAAVTPLVRRLALAIGAVDEPGGRHLHEGRIPRLGGLAVLTGVGGALALTAWSGVDLGALLAAYGWHSGWLLAGALIVAAAGAVDDIVGLGPLAKLGWQLLAGVMALAGGYGFSAVTNPLGGGVIDFGWLGPLVTLLWVVGVTNAFNLIDGLDGLAAGVGLIAALTLVAVSAIEQRPDAALLGCALGGALAGFLFFNFNPATIFLGDSGSLLLGYALAVLSIQSLQKGTTTVLITVPLLALGLPLMDVALALLRRSLAAGAGAIFRADAAHIHHRLLGRGLSHRRAVLVLYAVCVAFSGLAFLAVVARGKVDTLIVGLVVVATFFGVRALREKTTTKAPRHHDTPS
ncbi:MAG: MraY family glycosyltransferase [Deltaproteobacteria bacterium]|nr:MraY family glycosyltransferase [Deltaproteobacteria bacterium]